MGIGENNPFEIREEIKISTDDVTNSQMTLVETERDEGILMEAKNEEELENGLKSLENRTTEVGESTNNTCC